MEILQTLFSSPFSNYKEVMTTRENRKLHNDTMNRKKFFCLIIFICFHFPSSFPPFCDKNVCSLKVNGDDRSNTMRSEEQLIESLISTPIVEAVSKIKSDESEQQS